MTDQPATPDADYDITLGQVLDHFGISPSAPDRDKLVVDRLFSDQAIGKAICGEIRRRQGKSTRAGKPGPQTKLTALGNMALSRLFDEYKSGRPGKTDEACLKGFAKSHPGLTLRANDKQGHRGGGAALGTLLNRVIKGRRQREQRAALRRRAAALKNHPSLGVRPVTPAGHKAAHSKKPTKTTVEAIEQEAESAEMAKLIGTQILLGDKSGFFVRIPKK
jgi:hypothetical protein